jgi:hypothetical protein
VSPVWVIRTYLARVGSNAAVVKRRARQTPTKEWPLIVVEEHGALLVIREWPDGAITVYAADLNRS